MRIIGESGRSRAVKEVRMAIRLFVVLFVCHCFMWFMVLGGRVIVE